MDGKSAAEELIKKLLNGSHPLQAVSAAPKPDDINPRANLTKRNPSPCLFLNLTSSQAQAGAAHQRKSFPN